MTEFEITEATAVQLPMVHHAEETGWKPLTPTEATEKRGGEAGLLFRDELEEELCFFNPWMSADAVRSAVEGLEVLPATIEGNREMLACVVRQGL